MNAFRDCSLPWPSTYKLLICLKHTASIGEKRSDRIDRNFSKVRQSWSGRNARTEIKLSNAFKHSDNLEEKVEPGPKENFQSYKFKRSSCFICKGNFQSTDSQKEKGDRAQRKVAKVWIDRMRNNSVSKKNFHFDLDILKKEDDNKNSQKCKHCG